MPSVAVSKADDSFDLMGYALPPGTIVSTQSWSMHRDPDVFPSPETFLPERWLFVEGAEGEDERLARYAFLLLREPSTSHFLVCSFRMNQYLIPFGVGTRACGGQTLAQTVLRMVVAALASNFDVFAHAQETNERSMEMRDAFVCFLITSFWARLIKMVKVLFPASKECKLTFSARKH